MPRSNRLFESLGPATRERLRPHVDIVVLDKGRILCEAEDTPRRAYFPLDGMVSFVGLTEDGHALELTAGSDGSSGRRSCTTARRRRTKRSFTSRGPRNACAVTHSCGNAGAVTAC
jgi:hypothetical protein